MSSGWKTGLRGGGCTPSTRRSLHIQGMDRDEKLGLSGEGIWKKGLRVQ
ncbi:hypothetical protein FOVG_02002 [Fusarium oxysporum f. sp. pisi HDV247]|uniref:Uncharacterized protein n=1 Tax=Fusarium oxysporum f. sp. pisi HDV247 TaxID=1080344 RepID=W9QV85_FUSOX|nr:hypothetical protein FOVG_02002 [Fusarium oxysporum f. sp. pisi HDV247]